MNWDAIQAVADVCGVFAVMISIIYVGREIHTNSKSVQAATTHSLAMGLANFVDAFLADPKLANAWLIGSRDMTEVDDDYKGQVLGVVIKAMRLSEDVFLQYRNGTISESYWAGWKNWILMMANLDSVKKFLDARAAEYSVEFLDFLRSEQRPASYASIRDIVDSMGIGDR